ncbi:hypothetical protein EDC30_10145 [Paucimonas lemoignei]|uniref:Uncharacterized protein n=1 Tax=Paucimonas lemoignei TaxID=29443 RepID=A0A4R3I337_PAULE|nr:hypothetical protein EDC30_10145 [Paucimonas lemoignei]
MDRSEPSGCVTAVLFAGSLLRRLLCGVAIKYKTVVKGNTQYSKKVIMPAITECSVSDISNTT